MKSELRKQMRQLSSALTAEQRLAMSDAVCREIAETYAWQQAHTILLYHALPDEVSLAPLLALGQTQGKCLLLPVVEGNNLLLRQYLGDDSLTPGAFGILQPSGPDFSDLSSIQLCLVPGRAFDAQGRRLGRGRGYYDRLLPSLLSATLYGVCFPFQLVPFVPSEEHDIPVHRVFCGERID